MGGKIVTYFSKKLPADSRERYRALAELGYAPLFTAYQRHGVDIVLLRKPYVYPGLDALIADQPEGDAIVTDQPGQFIGVKTADCVPILLWDEGAGVIAAVHAGWRGTASDIAGKTVRAMRDGFAARHIRAAIGPCICQNCYTTRGDVPDAMAGLAGGNCHEHIKRITSERYKVDLSGINTALLREAGVLDVAPPPGCTCCDPETYWSHRRHGLERGSQVSLIGLGVGRL